MTKLSFDLRSGRWIASLAIGALCVALTAPSTTAGPVQCQVQHGDIVISQNGNFWLIQASNHAILQCQSFDIASFETVQFLQPGSLARVLMRITDNDVTNIDGTLLANGFVFFANPAGIIFGNNAVVNVGGIYAAAGNITNSNFINDINTFTLNGPVTNNGQIVANHAVHLLGQTVANHGTIIAGNGGVITMISASGVTLTPVGGGVSVQLTGGGGTVAGTTGVTNTGTLSVTNGQVVLGAGDLWAMAINNSGTIDASGSEVVFTAASGDIEHTGAIVAHEVTMTVGNAYDIRLGSNGVAPTVDTTGDQTYDGSVILIDDVELMAGGSATIHFTDTVDALTAGGQSLNVEAGTIDFDGNVGSITALKSLEVVGYAKVAGDVTTTNGILFDGNVVFDGTGAQTADAGTGVLDINGNVTKATNDLTLKGTTIELGGALTQATTGDLNLMGNVVFDGSGDQTALAGGILDIDGNVTKATDDLTLQGTTIKLGGALTQATTGDLNLMGEVVLDRTGNQSVVAGDVLTADGDMHKTGAGNLTLAGNVGIDLNGDVDVVNGSLTIQDDFSVEGDLTASDNITLMGDGILDGAGNQRIDAVTGSLWAQESLTKTMGGNLTLGGGAGIRLDGAVDVRAGDLTVEDDVQINGGLITTSGDQTYEGEVDLGHDTLFEGDDILFEGAIHGHAFDLSVDADTTTFQDIIEAVGHLFVDGVTFIGGDITVLDGMEFGDAVILIGNADLIDLGVVGIIFRSTIDGPFLLFIKTGGDALFQGDIGVNAALAGFETDVAGFMLFDDAVFEIHSTGDVIFNQALNSVPAFATIGSTGHLRIFAANFTMGQNQKLTVLGDLLIDLLGGTATLGDINTLGDLIVNAGQIFLLSREPGFVIDAFGNIIFDLGLDFVAGGRFFFSVNPIVLGGGIVLFANPNGDGDALGTLQGFIMRAFGQEITSADLMHSHGVFFDLTAQGPTNANVAVTIAGAVVRESETEKIEQGLTLGATAVEELLRNLRIRARSLTAPEEQSLSAGRALFDDSGETRVDFPSDIHTILLDRMHPTLTQGSLDRYKQLAPVDAPNDVRDRLKVAWNDYQDTADRAKEATTPEGFVVYLVRVANRVALADLRLLDQVLQELSIAGPTRYELSRPRGFILDDFKPPVTQSFFQDVLEAVRTMPEQGE
ncbi:MAG: filamentous hemagglutinin N-terminal domain-containing protein [Phycisphaerales bacterium]